MGVGPKIVVVDDEQSMREFLTIMLEKEHYEVSAFPSAELAIEHFRENVCDLVITDLKMPGGKGGVDLLKELKDINPEVVVIMITAYSSVDSAVEAMKAGAYDYFTKPFNIDEIKMHVKRALRLKRLEHENILLKKDIKSRRGFGKLIGTSERMEEVYRVICSIAGTRMNVLITGESGTGKELVARAIHDESPRKDKPFVTVNCAAIPENLLESELFGHVKGSFTGATSDKPGLAEMACSGTLFLDEISEIPLILQVKLLRFIQEKTVRRVGGTKDIPVDIRVLAASNRDLEDEMKGGRFREDLYYRLNVISIHTPALRERKEDIHGLATHFVDVYSKEFDKVISGIEPEAFLLLESYDYPGNVRELENAIERAVALESSDVITPESLPPSINTRVLSGAYAGVRSDEDARDGGMGGRLDIPPEGLDLEEAVSDFERRIILDALKKTGGAKKKAADLLKISFRQFRYKLSKYEE